VRDARDAKKHEDVVETTSRDIEHPDFTRYREMLPRLEALE
jgi:hypothetical protein